MPQGRKTSSFLVSAAIFILLEVAALVMLHFTSTLQDIWINRASHRTMAFLWGHGESVRAYGRLEAEQEELARMAARDSASYRYIPATVVKMSRNRSHNYIILNKGSEDGVRPQSGIISDKGVVGIVEAVDRHYSYGRTLMDLQMSVGARIGRTEVVSLLSWDGIRSNGAVVRNLPPHYSVEPGDTVRTSGYSTIFPPDVPIGVTGESHLVEGSTRAVDVTLFQDFSTVRYVTVVENLERTEIMALEAAGEGER